MLNDVCIKGDQHGVTLPITVRDEAISFIWVHMARGSILIGIGYTTRASSEMMLEKARKRAIASLLAPDL